MLRLIIYILIGLVTSFFLFPFNLPLQGVEVNTKMIMAVIGAGLFVLDRASGRGPTVSKDFLLLSLICAIISVWGLFVTVFNGTGDYAFAKYLISVWVWLGAAYLVVWLLKAVHGEVTVEIVSNYLVGVCVAQCLLAYAMTIWPSLAEFIDGLMGEGDAFMSATEGRLHGLGAALDPAGLRFSAVLVLLAFLTARTDFDSRPWLGIIYLLSFFLITVIGNMIARTTLVGTVVAIVLYIILRRPRGGVVRIDRSWGIIGAALAGAVILSVILYNVDASFRSNIRFGFEGFFSLAETGHWEVRSNEILKKMIVWPETLKTWVIGDGFFDSPEDMPDRFGQVLGGFYMRTDIGYLRFVFYFGVVGLLGMMAAFVYMTVSCIRNLKGHTLLFLSLLLINFIGWLKVSSDIIMVLAPFLILAFLKQGAQSQCTSSIT